MFRTFFILITGTLILSAIFTPFVMSLLLQIDPDIGWPFSRIFDRVAMLAVAAMIYFLHRDFKLNELRRYFSFRNKGAKVRDLCAGATLTFVSIFLVIPLLVNAGLLNYKPELKDSFYFDVVEIFLAMTLVSVIEESFFRILVFSNLKERMSVIFAAITSSLIYAFAHFIAPVKSFQYTEFNLLSGFIYLGEIFNRYLQPDIYPAFFGLFIVGMILCYVIYKSKSVFLCIGLHTGWAAGLKFIRHYTDLPAGTVIPDELGGRYFLVAQPFAWLSMLVVFFILMIILRFYRNPDHLK